jgi:hypothetical protein
MKIKISILNVIEGAIALTFARYVVDKARESKPVDTETQKFIKDSALKRAEIEAKTKQASTDYDSKNGPEHQ